MAKTIRDMENYNKAQDEWHPSIRMFCCECAGEGACDSFEAPDGVSTEVLPCTGKIDTRRLMKVFESGVDGVFIVGCPPEECRMVEGSVRAERRSMFVRRLLDEIGVGGDRIEIVTPSAGSEEFSKACFNLYERILALGPSEVGLVAVA